MNEDTKRRPLETVRALKRTGNLGGAVELAELTMKQTSDDKAELLFEIAEMSGRLGHFDRAHAVIEELLRMNAVERQNAVRLKIIEQQALIAFMEGQYREAGAQAQRLYTELQRAGLMTSPLLASVHNVLGGVAWHQGRINDAIAHVQQSAQLCGECGDDFGNANAQRNLGVLHFTNGDWKNAIESFTKSEDLCNEIGCSIGRAATLLNLGILETSTGEHARARKHLEQCVESSDRSGEAIVRKHAEIALAHLDLVEGNADGACKRVDAILDDPMSAPEDAIVQASWLKSTIECDRGGVASALGLAAKARDMARGASLVECEADCCRALGHAYLSSQAFGDAEQALTESVALAEKIRDPYRRALALLDLTSVYEQTDRQTDAQKQIEEATKIFTTLGARHDLARAQSIKARLSH